MKESDCEIELGAMEETIERQNAVLVKLLSIVERMDRKNEYVFETQWAKQVLARVIPISINEKVYGTTRRKKW
jgi:hypothetical protein